MDIKEVIVRVYDIWEAYERFLQEIYKNKDVIGLICLALTYHAVFGVSLED